MEVIIFQIYFVSQFEMFYFFNGSFIVTLEISNLNDKWFTNHERLLLSYIRHGKRKPALKTKPVNLLVMGKHVQTIIMLSHKENNHCKYMGRMSAKIQ